MFKWHVDHGLVDISPRCELVYCRNINNEVDGSICRAYQGCTVFIEELNGDTRCTDLA
jgi:hypothetical protein